MEFRLHNEEGIQFPQINPAFQEGELFFDRFRALISRNATDSVIGEGGTGLIHLVRDELMDRVVALKLPHESIARDPSARGDVIRETRQAIDLTHANIVRIHDFHEGLGGWGISMQYVKGKNLDEWRHVGSPSGVNRSIAPYHVDRIENWILQLCDALTYAHEDAKMVHRDIKPKNLMLQRLDNGEEKLLLTDFGITQKLRLHTMMLSRVQPERQDNTAAGTLPYMPWSQIDGESASVLDDIYAVGATIYDLLTGRPPFYEGGYEQIRHQIQNTVPPSMEYRLQEFDIPSSGIPQKWEDVVASCLAKDPADRPQSTKEIIARLGLNGAVATITSNPKNEKELQEAQATVAHLTDENQKLSEQIQQSSAESTQLSEETSALKQQIETHEKSIGEWQSAYSQLETAYSQLEESASADGDKALVALQATLSQKEAELSAQLKNTQQLEAQAAEFQNRITEEETKCAQLQDLLNNSESTDEEALAIKAQADSKIHELKQKNESLESRATELQNHIAEEEAKCVQLQEQIASSATSNEEAQAIEIQADAAIKNLKQEKKTLESQATEWQSRLAEEEKKQAQLQKEISSAQKTTQEALAKSQSAESTIEKITKKAKAAEEKVNNLKGKQTASLMPLLFILLGALLIGSIAGGVLGKFTAPKGTSTNLTELSFSDEVPDTIGDTGEMVTTALFRQYLQESGVPQSFIESQFEELANREATEPAAGISFATATRFCGWLTARLSDGLDEEQYYRVATSKEIEETKSPNSPPEWSIELFIDPNTNAMIGQQLIGTNEHEAKFQNLSSATTLSPDPRGIGFRVTLDEARGR